jgi:hypothetical protein
MDTVSLEFSQNLRGRTAPVEKDKFGGWRGVETLSPMRRRRSRLWLVEAVAEPVLTSLPLSCIADDAQGEQIEVLWDSEIGARRQDDTWPQVGRAAPVVGTVGQTGASFFG